MTVVRQTSSLSREDNNRNTAASRYAALESARDPYLRRARQCAALTIPYLMPPSGFGTTTDLPTPFQSLGARGVRTLASKMGLALFPPGTVFFKYLLDDLTVRKIEEQMEQAPGMRGTLEAALAAREKAVGTELEDALFRPAASTSFLHLLVAGNHLLYIPPKGVVRNFRLDQYVVRRDAAGNVLEIIVKEGVSPASLIPEVRAFLNSDKTAPANADRTLDLFTHIQLDFKKNQWTVYQEVKGKRIPGTEGTYPRDKLPWLALRFSSQPGEDYGRSYVEEYLGDLDSLEGLTQTIVEGSAAVARVVFLVSPNGSTSIRTITKARNGDVVSGDANDVSTIQAQKAADLSVARQQATDIAQALAYAFLMHSAVQRKGERVTAEEVRIMAADLDDALGGVYTLLGPEFQLPIARLFEQRMEKNRDVPPLPADMVRPVLITGLEALGRGHDQRNLKLLLTDLAGILGPEGLMTILKPGEVVRRAAAAYGVDPEGLFKSEQDIAQEQQMAQMQQMIQQLGPSGIQSVGRMAQEGMKQAGAATQQPPEA